MLKLDFSKSGIKNTDLEQIKPEIIQSFARIKARESDMLGWVDLPKRLLDGAKENTEGNPAKEELDRILALSDKIRAENSSITLLIIGIGGSYLGACSFIEAIGASEGINVLYAGNHMSNRELTRTYAIAAKADNLYCVVISKSGTTLEPAFAFHIFEQLIHDKYGGGASEHIFAITDAHKGVLRNIALTKNYETFVVPDDIGGRYSIFTPVGLLPIALACGSATVRELIEGSGTAAQNLASTEDTNPALQYAALRNIFYRGDKQAELLATFEPSFSFVSEWWKQLFGESEGKDDKGLWVSSAIYSTDLHSLGQFVQSGSPLLFETFVEFAEIPDNDDLPLSTNPENENAGNTDGLNYLNGKTLAYVQRAALEATKTAHTEGSTPNISLILNDFSAQSLGYFYYFMMLSCAISAYTLGVNPFDQPGVENYKQKMFSLLEQDQKQN